MTTIVSDTGWISGSNSAQAEWSKAFPSIPFLMACTLFMKQLSLVQQKLKHYAGYDAVVC